MVFQLVKKTICPSLAEMSWTVGLFFLCSQAKLITSVSLHPMITNFDVLDYSANALHDQHTRIKRSVAIGTYQRYSSSKKELKLDVQAFNQ